MKKSSSTTSESSCLFNEPAFSVSPGPPITARAKNKDEFEALYKYSPLHNVKPGTKYPPTLITTADHDDRVFPGHSCKFAATFQAAQSGPAPILIRIETRAGHGAGKPTTKIIEEQTDQWTFLVKNLEIQTSFR